MCASYDSNTLKTLFPTIPEAIRQSLLFSSFADKLDGLPANAFPFAAEFGRLREIIAPQIGETRILFPEFTPHDELLHVAELFQLADKLFGNRLYRELNAAEHFLLAAALYAHDWGMAVGTEEQEFLRSLASSEPNTSVFSALRDESDRCIAFVKSEGGATGSVLSSYRMTEQELRLYVRTTHARRSAARVRTHFHTHTAVGEALAHLCEGHWHDFATLDDRDRFPREYEIGGQTVHLLALTLHLRLIDLFHITDDRTPYALWRFVSPTDTRSKEEWAKHRALHGLSVFEFTPGRGIKLQGSTEDEEVWAGLQDLRRYCKEQIDHSLDIAARHIPARYALDFIKLEWAVTTGTLSPIDLRFTFDRSAMFRILSEDIYQGNPYVFLRELLQNAVDAIRTRKARLEKTTQGLSRRKAPSLAFDATIYFSVGHDQTGDITITCRDNGIGMDEHVLRNYFAVAGVSYYRSREFEHQHLGFEPISRFGVGVLSSFMCSDSLQVKTYRDPACTPPIARNDLQLPGMKEYRARPLCLTIPGIERQFVVKEIVEPFEVGTEVMLKISAAKVRKLHEVFEEPKIMAAENTSTAEPPPFKRSLTVSEYLTDVAGFVEFPIHIREIWPGRADALTTLILHPSANAARESAEYADNPTVCQLSQAYPWNEVTESECIGAVNQYMAERCFSLSKLLEDDGYEGWIVFPKPTYEEWDFTNEDTEMGQRMQKNQVVWYERETGKPLGERISWKAPSQYNELKPTGILLAVYRQGILLEAIKQASLPRSHQCFPLPLIRVNLPSSGTPRTNLARTELAFRGERKWDDAIWPAVANAIARSEAEALKSLCPRDRYFRVGWLGTVYRMSQSAFRQPEFEWLALSKWLSPGGEITLREGELKEGEEVPLLPTALVYAVSALAVNFWRPKGGEEKVQVSWRGPASLIQILWGGWSVPIQVALEISQQWSAQRVVSVRRRFLKPPAPVKRLLSQAVAIVLSDAELEEASRLQSLINNRAEFLKEPAVQRIFATCASNVADLSPLQLRVLANILAVLPYNESCLPFSAPFDSFCGSEDEDLNPASGVGQAFYRLLAHIAMTEITSGLPSSFVNKFRNLGSFRTFRSFEMLPINAPIAGKIRMRDFVQKVFSLAADHDLANGIVPPALPEASQWAPIITGGATLNIIGTPKYSPELCAFDFGDVVTQFP